MKHCVLLCFVLFFELCCDLTAACRAPELRTLCFAWPISVGVLGHSVVEAEVRKANGIDAATGQVAPVGVAAAGSENRATHRR